MDTKLQETIYRDSNLLRQIVKKMVDVRKAESAGNLPSLPEELEPLSNCLGKSDFTLVVSGEVNRGKSTFINAIIGQDILPTFDKETTSQVFKIKNAKEKSFSVVLEDGTQLPIQENELNTYGTELANSEDVKKLNGKRILFIEVHVPIANLPKDVTIVDTPGIGSTFKSHTEIAKSFMQEADAVIYICSSKHPIVKVDIDFIKSTILPLKTSPNVLFVMAKADLADSEDALADMVSRAEKQLSENFVNFKNIGKKVIPVDSLSLKASNESSDSQISSTLRFVSNYDAVNNEVNQLIERQKFLWLVSTFNCAARYYKKTNQFLEKQISDYDLSETSRQERLTEINNKLNKFENDFGATRQREITDEIANILTALETDIRTEFGSSNSSILKKYYDRVDNLPKRISSEKLNFESEEMSKDILDDATNVWEQLSGKAIAEVQDAICRYHNECQVEIDELYRINVGQSDEFSVDIDVTMSDRIDAMRGKYFLAAFVGGVVAPWTLSALGGISSTAASLATSFAFGPVGFAVTGATILYGIFYGNRKAKERVVARAKGEIKTHLKEILDEVYNQLAATSLMHGQHQSTLTTFKRSIKENATDAISSIYNKIFNELQAAKAEIINSANKQNRVRLVNQQTLFNNFAISLQKLLPDLKQLNNSFETI